MTTTAHTYCDLCLSACGLEVEIDSGRIVAARGDRAHPLSAGYLCVKGKHGPASRQGPERLLHPLKRTEAGWEQISWDQAYREVAARLRQIRQRHGPQAIGMYYGAGNPTSFFNFLFAQGFMSALGSRSFFNVLSLEFTGRYLVQEKMYGHALFATAGDFERTDFVLMFGHNPAISEEDPRKMAHMAEMRARGGTLVVVDPRRTETARKADRWVPITPGSRHLPGAGAPPRDHPGRPLRSGVRGPPLPWVRPPFPAGGAVVPRTSVRTHRHRRNRDREPRQSLRDSDSRLCGGKARGVPDKAGHAGLLAYRGAERGDRQP